MLIDEDDQNESLFHPHQAMVHQCKFNLTPMGRLDANEQLGKPQMIVEDMVTPFY